jgi:hypothetical protein
MNGELVLCSESAHKVAAVRAAFGKEVVVKSLEGAAPSFNPAQPVGDEYGLVCACMRLQSTDSQQALAVESFLRVQGEKTFDVVCAVLRVHGRVFCEMGGDVLVPADIARQLFADASNKHSLAGFVSLFFDGMV